MKKLMTLIGQLGFCALVFVFCVGAGASDPVCRKYNKNGKFTVKVTNGTDGPVTIMGQGKFDDADNDSADLLSNKWGSRTTKVTLNAHETRSFQTTYGNGGCMHQAVIYANMGPSYVNTSYPEFYNTCNATDRQEHGDRKWRYDLQECGFTIYAHPPSVSSRYANEQKVGD